MARQTTPKPPAGPNTAQAEFERYASRRRAEAAADPAPASPFPGEGLTWAGPGLMPVWVGGPPPGHHGGHGHRGEGGVEEAVGDVAAGVGTTVRLGVDLLNAALFNTIKILGGFTSAYGYGGGGEGGCGCGSGCGCSGGCGCESCCEPSCCQPSCCGCECCNPGVGTCC
jgi:hypothetical protein